MNVVVVTRTDTKEIIAVVEQAGWFNPRLLGAWLSRRYDLDRKLLHFRLITTEAMPAGPP
jgi:hypothetical protein